MVNGEYGSSNPTETAIKGRLEISSGTKRVKDPNGNFIEISGTFFTKAAEIAGAEKLVVNGRTFKILQWVPYQTYSEIWLD